MLNRIRIVLVNTSHPGNIGSAARAMKTMGLSALYLVEPQQFPDAKAMELASGASDILAGAQVVATLDEAIADCTLVVGTSARMRTIPWPLLSPREMVAQISQEPSDSRIAILFGREQSGLANEELQRCHLHVHIPTDSFYSSLNIAAAVQIIAYELRLACIENNITAKKEAELATINELENFFEHLQTVLVEIDFLKLSAPRKLMTRLRRLYLRARLDKMEVNMLRGMLTAIQITKKL